MNNNGVLFDRDTGGLIPDFEIWPGPVPEGALYVPQIGIPSNHRSALRRVLKDASKEIPPPEGLDFNAWDYQVERRDF